LLRELERVHATARLVAAMPRAELPWSERCIDR
jgi:hypothetical protein